MGADWTMDAWIVSGGILLVAGALGLTCVLGWLALLLGWIEVKAFPPAHEAGVVLAAVEEHVENGRCAVCCTPLGDRVRRCGRCRTPHHAECWAYNDGCAVFACDRRP